MILSNLLWVEKSKIKNLNEIRQQLTVFSKYDNATPIETFEETEDYFGFPRNIIPVPEGTEDRRVKGNPIDITFKGKLRPIQEKVIQDWEQSYKNGNDDCIINLQTGVGKTIVAIKIASILKVPFLVIVPRERLVGQWIDQIKAFTDIEDVGIIQQNKCEYEGRSACVGMVHSICKDKYPDEFKKHFGLIIYEELHVLGAETFSLVVKMFPAKHFMGLSATLNRADGKQDAYFNHLGKNIITTEKRSQPDPRVFIYKYEGDSGRLPYWLDVNDPVKVRACILSNLANNEDRNDKIANFADLLMSKGLQTLVIGDRIAQLKEIEAILKAKGHEDIGLYISKTSDKRKRWLEKNGKCILATTKMLDIGIDIDTLRGLIFATPHSEVEQIVGRVRRINLNQPDPVVIDFHDIKYPVSKRWSDKRERYYNKENFIVKEVSDP